MNIVNNFLMVDNNHLLSLTKKIIIGGALIITQGVGCFYKFVVIKNEAMPLKQHKFKVVEFCIWLSLKEIEGRNFKYAYDNLKQFLLELFIKFDFLINDEKINYRDLGLFRQNVF